MAKPIKGSPVLKGRAADDFLVYLKNAKPDAEKRKKHAAYRAIHRQIKVVK